MSTLKRRLVLSFTVFAMFFGAGNLIFPPLLAYMSGDNIVLSFLGFVSTAIGLPVIAVIAIGRVGSAEKLASRVHPVFGTIFTITIYLAIGPCLAIPRTASTSYEMLINAYDPSISLFRVIYSALFFIIGGILALNPEKLTKRLGRVLSPILVTLIAVLFIFSLFCQGNTMLEASDAYKTHPFQRGFQEGYQTMDALAGLVFGIIISLNVRTMGVREEEERKECAIAALGGGLLLLIIYLMIVFVGIAARGLAVDVTNGAEVLSIVAYHISPKYGRTVLALIFMIACLNTAISLLSSCGEYFNSLMPRISRTGWIAIFSTLSFLISNIGLDEIISISSPILSLLYPAAIILIALSFLPDSDKLRYTYIISVTLAILSSLLMITGVFSSAFSWIPSSLLGALIGLIIDRKKPSMPS